MQLGSAPASPALERLSLTTAILRPARLCFELFCDAERVPQWNPIVRSVRIERIGEHGRPEDVSCLASIDRATVGYRLRYDYREREMTVAWATAPDACIIASGQARFTPLRADATIFTYESALDPASAMSSWGEPLFGRGAVPSIIRNFSRFAVSTLT